MLYFVDESGSDLGESPCSVLAGIGMREADVWPFTQAYSALKEEILRFPAERHYETKGAKLLHRRIFRLAEACEPLPDHARSAALERLYEKNASGEPLGREELGALGQAKIAFVDQALDLAAESGVTAFASIVPRDAPQAKDLSFLRKDFVYLFERIHCHVCAEGEDAHAVLIHDENETALLHRLLDQMHRYFTETEKGRQRALRMIPMPFFVRSHLTPTIEAVDLVAYVTNWALRLPHMNEPVREELTPLAEKVHRLCFEGTDPSPGRRFNKRITGIAYIRDLRPRDQQDDAPASIEELQPAHEQA